MQPQLDKAELRKHKRFKANNNAYALLKQKNYTELGRILDISKSGISFLCLNEGDWAENDFFIDILVGNDPYLSPDNGSCISNIPLKPIIYSTDNYHGAGPHKIMKRCGVEFADLPPEQREQILQFIMNHTCGNA